MLAIGTASGSAGGLVGGISFSTLELGSFWQGFLMGAIAGGLEGYASGGTENELYASNESDDIFKGISMRKINATACRQVAVSSGGSAIIGAIIMRLPPPPWPQIVGGTIIGASAYMAATACGFL